MPTGDALAAAKKAYVVAARTAGRGMSRLGVGRGGPPARQRRIAHWAYSLTRVHDSIEMAKLDVPWWTYGAIDHVERWLAARPRPVRVFEYGSGASTVWLARRADEVHSVEHHSGFAGHMAPTLVELPNVHVLLIEPVPSSHAAVSSGKEGQGGLDFSDYVAAIDQVEGSFDLIVVDGRARAACLAAAIPRMAPEGIIVFDNSARRRYRPGIEASGLSERIFRGLVPTLPYPDQTSILISQPA